MKRFQLRCLAFGIVLALTAPQALPQSQWSPPGSSAPARPAPTRQTAPEPADPLARAKIHTELAAAYFEIGNMAVALEEIAIALESDPKFTPAYSLRGLVHTKLREFDQAEQQFRKALSLAPNDAEVNNNYGWFLCHTGKERQSISYFLNALKNPLYATPEKAYGNAGRCALKAGDLDGAEEYLKQAIKISRGNDLMPRLQLATLNYLRGNLPLARHQVTTILQTMTTPSAEVIWLALRIERKLGNRTEEGAMAARLRNLYPDSPEYQEFLKGNFE